MKKKPAARKSSSKKGTTRKSAAKRSAAKKSEPKASAAKKKSAAKKFSAKKSARRIERIEPREAPASATTRGARQAPSGYSTSPCPDDPTKWIVSKTDANGQSQFWTLPWGTYPS